MKLDRAGQPDLNAHIPHSEPVPENVHGTSVYCNTEHSKFLRHSLLQSLFNAHTHTRGKLGTLTLHSLSVNPAIQVRALRIRSSTHSCHHINIINQVHIHTYAEIVGTSAQAQSVANSPQFHVHFM